MNGWKINVMTQIVNFAQKDQKIQISRKNNLPQAGPRNRLLGTYTGIITLPDCIRGVPSHDKMAFERLASQLKRILVTALVVSLGEAHKY